MEEKQQKDKKCKEYLEGWQRAKADLINYKKDEAKRFEEVVKFSNQSLIKEAINVLDSFDLSLASLEKENFKLVKGVYMIRAQLEDVLRKFGLERIIVSVGQPFDLHLHETIGEAESDKPSGTIIEEIERGYLLYGKVIRPARVRTAK